jgi:hypothetical protein
MTRREPRREKSSRPDRPSDERSLDALLEGSPLPDGDLTRWQPVSQVLTALTWVPASSELSGEARALAEFRVRPRPGAEPAPAGQRRRLTRRRRVTGLRRVTRRYGPRPAVAVAAGAVLIGGFLAVAYAGDLPAAAQRLAHYTIGAPAAGRDPSAGLDPGRSSRLATSAGRASARSGHGSPQPDRRTPHGSASGSPRDYQPSGSPSGTASGRPPGLWWPGQQAPGHRGSGSPGPGSPAPGSPDPSGSPSDSPTPAPTQQPSPSASLAPSGAATPSPSATASTSGGSRQHRQPDPGSTSSSPP